MVHNKGEQFIDTKIEIPYPADPEFENKTQENTSWAIEPNEDFTKYPYRSSQRIRSGLDGNIYFDLAGIPNSEISLVLKGYFNHASTQKKSLK